MELTQRQKLIFQTIVERFTSSAEPVGSRTLMEYLDIPLSSATIRNEMAVLERAGLLEKTHTSSGRIPSQKGYRYYVTCLMKADLTESAKEAVRHVFDRRYLSMDDMLKTATDILSEMTQLTSVASGADSTLQKVHHIQLIPVSPHSAVALIVTSAGLSQTHLFEFDQDISLQELTQCMQVVNEHLSGVPVQQAVARLQALEPVLKAQTMRYEVLLEALVTGFMSFAHEKIAVSGRSNMLAQPEFSDTVKVRKLMQILENSDLFKAWTSQKSNIAIPLGSRNELIQIGDCSIVTAHFQCKKEAGQLMVVGPNRMPYAKVVAITDYMSQVIEEAFGENPEGGMQDEQ